MRVQARAGSFIRTLAMFTVVLATVSCSGGPSEPVAPPVSQIVLSPLTPTVVAGQNVTLSAQLKDAAGNAVTGQGVAWTTSDATIANVSGGVVTALKPGTATITATSGTASANTTVTVLAAIAQVVVTPSPADVVINQTVQLTATLRDAAGAEIPARNITWSSSSDAAATVSATGLVTGKVVGAVTITATAEGKVGQTTVNVRPVPVARVTVTPEQLSLEVGNPPGQLTARTYDAGNTELGRPVSWSSSNNGIATVSADGKVTAVSAGTTTITAKSEDKTASATVVVTRSPVASVEISPSSPTVEAGVGTTLEAVTKDADGRVLLGRTVTWSSNDLSKVTVSAAGVVTGMAPGTATITAMSEGKSGTTTVNVVDRLSPTVHGLKISPSATVNAGSQVTFTAQLKDGSGVKFLEMTAYQGTADSPTALKCVTTTPEASTTVRDGSFSCTVTIPPNAAKGEWQLRLLTDDVNGLRTIYFSEALAREGMNPSTIIVQ
jgi:uncharacterized protein YjdB